MIIGFVSDIHEDVDSLVAALSAFEKARCDAVVCLGDIVGFTLPFHRYIARRDANACIALVQDHCIAVVAGNHDLYAIRRCPAFTAGFDYGEHWYELDYETRAKRSRGRIWLYEDSELPHKLTIRSMEYLQSLPEYRVSAFDGTRFLLSHFHYPDLSGSTVATPRKARHLAEHFRFMEEHGCSMSVSGHGHPEGYARADSRALIFGGFGTVRLDREAQWVVCPCVANTTRQNGLLLFDTGTRQLDAIPLGSPKIIV